MLVSEPVPYTDNANPRTAIQVIMAAFQRYVTALWSGTAEPFWPHAVLIMGGILAGILVGIGILLDIPEHPAPKQRIAFWVVMIGIIIEPICTLGLFKFDEAISQQQQEKIISLEERLLPRNLSPEAISRVEQKVCPFGPRKYSRVFVIFGDILFADQLGQVFNACKWSDIGISDRDSAVAAASGVMGMTFWYAPERTDEFREVATIFADSLSAEGIPAKAVPMPPDKKMSHDAINIIFGAK
jgi:hypothetical protein